MGSPGTTYLFSLSFTSYNPDITSDYRQGFKWQKRKASLLGYNQIILYSSLSVYYYQAPGPSFFNTDIRNFSPLITYFPPLDGRTPFNPMNHATASLVATLEYGRSLVPIYDTCVSVEPHPGNVTANEHKDTQWKVQHIHLNVHTRLQKPHTHTGHYPIMVISTRASYDVITVIKYTKSIQHPKTTDFLRHGEAILDGPKTLNVH